MAPELANVECSGNLPALAAGLGASPAKGSGEANLLMEAFEIFTQASSSLELAFAQLQVKAQKLTEELAAKNLELEQTLREKQAAQNYLHTILERLPCGVIVLDPKGEIALRNPIATEVLQKSRSGRDRGGKRKQPHLSQELREIFAASADGGRSEVEIQFATGNKKKILATSGTPLADEAGKAIGTLHIIRDITEVKALQEKNKRIERLSAMGEMAAELAHEIRNPLGSIELFASLLVKECDGDPRRWAENIRIGTRSLNTIVSNMLHFANPISPVFSEVNIHEVIRDIGKFCDPVVTQRQLRLKIELEAGNPMMWADRELIRQMLLNLVFNAMKAMPAEGFLRLSTRNVAWGAGALYSSGLELQIEDSGIGIPPENLSRIFDPFFTTNKNGTGLGLSIVHQIIDRHSGTVRVSSEVNRGTTFTIVFGVLPQKE